MNTEAAEVPKFRQESPESPGSPVSDYQNVSGNADGDKPLNAKAHMSAIQDYIDQAKSELIHLHREKGELSTEIIRATDHVERELRGVASVLEIGIESKAKMLKMKMKTQKEDSSVFDPQLNGITNDNLQMKKLIDICNAKLERLEKKVGSYKGE